MICRRRLKTLLALGLPIIGGMLSQSLLNLIDTIMVGSLGETALAAVGIGGYSGFLAISLILGLSSSVQTLVARQRGSDKLQSMAQPLGWGLLLALAITLPLTLLFWSISEPLTALFSNDAAALTQAQSYFEYRLSGLLAIGISLCYRGYWNGSNRPVRYLRILLLVHLINVPLNYVFIFGAFGFNGIGAPGAGLGTSLSLYIGAALIVLASWKDTRQRGLFDSAGINLHNSILLLRLSVPHSLQQAFFAASVAVLFWIIGQLGTQQQAIAHILINLSLLLILPGVGLGIASTTLVSQALGQNRSEEALNWGWDVIKTAFVIMLLLSLPMWLAPDLLLSAFLKSPAAIEEARLPLILTGIAICVDAAAIVLTQSLLGAGASRTVMLVTTLGQWCFYLPLAWLTGPVLGYGLVGIWLVQILHRGLSSLIFIAIWQRQHWVHIRFKIL